MFIVLLTSFLQCLGGWTATLPGLRGLLFGLVGVDRRLLARCPREVASAYAGLGIYVPILAAFTAAGLGSRITPLMQAGALLSTLVHVLLFAAAMGLELMLMNSAGGSRWVMVARIWVSAVLMLAAQVLPSALAAYGDTLKLARHEHTLAAIAGGTQLAGQARGLPALQAELDRQSAAAAAAAAKVTDPGAPPQSVTDAAMAAADGVRKLTAARATLEAAKQAEARTKADIEARFAAAKDRELPQVERDRLKAWAEAVIARRQAAQQAFSKADALVEDLNAVEVAARGEWRRGLEQADAAARDSLAKSRQTLATAQGLVDKDAALTDQLARRAHAEHPIRDISALAAEAAKDWTIALVLLGMALTIMTFDLVPLAAKKALNEGPYGKAVATRAQMEASRLDGLLYVARVDAAVQMLRTDQQAAGARKWAELDAGDALAQELALDAQGRLDSSRATLAAQVTRTGVAAAREAIAEVKGLYADTDADARLGPLAQAHLAGVASALDRMARHSADTQAAATAAQA